MNFTWKLKILLKNGSSTEIQLANKYSNSDIEVISDLHKLSFVECKQDVKTAEKKFMNILGKDGPAFYWYEDLAGFEFIRGASE